RCPYEEALSPRRKGGLFIVKRVIDGMLFHEAIMGEEGHNFIFQGRALIQINKIDFRHYHIHRREQHFCSLECQNFSTLDVNIHVIVVSATKLIPVKKSVERSGL